MADLMQVSGLWKNTSANGEMYLKGRLGPNVQILIFKNKFKTAENQPDYQIYFAPVERRENEAENAPEEDDFLGGPAPSEEPAPAPAAARPAAPARASAPAPARPAPAAARPAPQRRTTPEPPTEDFGEMEDPFAD